MQHLLASAFETAPHGLDCCRTPGVARRPRNSPGGVARTTTQTTCNSATSLSQVLGDCEHRSARVHMSARCCHYARVTAGHPDPPTGAPELPACPPARH